MKVFISLAVVCLMACALADTLNLTEEQKAKALNIFQECVKQENVPEADAARLTNEDYANPTESMKCFGTCFFEKLGALKDGVIQEDLVLKKLGPHLGEEKIKNSLNKCKGVKGADRCDTGHKIYECLESPKADLAFLI